MAERLSWPLRLAADGRLAVVEQDSSDDIEQCIRAILLTRPGDRPDVPDLGVVDLTFGEQPLDLDGINEALARHEPRITTLLQTAPDALDELLADVTLNWERQPQLDPDQQET